MGSNVYLAAAKSFGYKTETASTAIVHNVDPRDGERIAIRALGLTAGASATTAHIMQALGESTIGTAVVSGATTAFAAAAEFQTSSNAVVSSDFIALELDDGSYQYTTIATGTWSDFSIADALLDTVAAGNKVFGFGVHGDSGHIKLTCTASVQTKWELDGGIFYADAKGRPVKIYHDNDAAAAGSIDYATIDYIER